MASRKSKKKRGGRVAVSTTSSVTRDRIVQRSILLFNRSGLRNVAIERIAADMKISPGNLTYHFPRKHQLIAATLDIMQDRLRTALERPTAVRSARDGADYLIRLYRTLWDFRFFFNALTYVLTDRALRTEYSKLHYWAIDTIQQDLIVLCKHGYFVLPTPPNTFTLVAENMWSLLLNWVRMQHIRSPSAATPSNAALFDCALHILSLCQPLMQPEYVHDLFEVFKESLSSDTQIRQQRATCKSK
jgi:AcrR family transcriptional regulator